MTIQAAISELSKTFGKRFSQSQSDLDLHGHSETYFPLTPPDAVVYPENTREVQKIVQICAKHQCPVIGWGTGTSLEAHSLAIQGGVCVDFSLMDKILDVNAEDMDVRVQPGVTREVLNIHLRDTGLFFPVDPGANASLGGMAMTRASGTTAVRYGTMRDNVMGFEAVLADGRIIRTGSRARKSSAGYDLTALLVGSEGTLALITEITLKLRGQPEAITAAICAFDDMSATVDCVIQTIQMGVPMARIEFVDAAMAKAFNIYASAELPEKPHLFVEFHGTDEAVAADIARFRELAEELGASQFDWASKSEDRTALWAMRHNAHFASMALRPGARVMVTDICVPISNLAQAVADAQADIETLPFPGTILGHVGDGNFHTELMFDENNPSEVRAVKEFSARMINRALKMGGTCTGEHGVGAGKLEFMQAEHGDAWNVMAEIKRALDPMNIMNPGKLVRLN